MSDKETAENSIYIFRCGESSLYALTADRTGQILPSRIYPRVRWRLERCVTLQRDKNSAKQECVKAALDAVKRRGFCLTHAEAMSLRFFEASDTERAPINQTDPGRVLSQRADGPESGKNAAGPKLLVSSD
jgi:hypothetical protein